MTVTWFTGQTQTTRTYQGTQKLVNRTEGEFGNGWSFADLDRLAISDAGALWVQGNNDTVWFAKEGNGASATYQREVGDLTFSTLVPTDPLTR